MAHSTDDIPEARRESLIVDAEPSLAKSSSSKLIFWLLLVFVGLGLGGATGFWWFRLRTPVASGDDVPGSVDSSAVTPSAAVAESGGVENAIAASPENSNPDTSEGSESDVSNSLLGHRPYAIADASDLVSISTNTLVQLKPEVAETVEIMMAEAWAIGINLDVISGFRSLEDQQYLFFDLKAERGQTTQTRAEVSAPPGYSEHHTGYAVDFIDGDQPVTDLSASFEDTEAFRWLEENAAYYGFEMSFPRGNKQNVAYEPWHWRYVGNQESLELFYQEHE